jgi:hypothetical protein
MKPPNTFRGAIELSCVTTSSNLSRINGTTGSDASEEKSNPVMNDLPDVDSGHDTCYDVMLNMSTLYKNDYDRPVLA